MYLHTGTKLLIIGKCNFGVTDIFLSNIIRSAAFAIDMLQILQSFWHFAANQNVCHYSSVAVVNLKSSTWKFQRKRTAQKLFFFEVGAGKHTHARSMTAVFGGLQIGPVMMISRYKTPLCGEQQESEKRNGINLAKHQNFIKHRKLASPKALMWIRESGSLMRHHYWPQRPSNFPPRFSLPSIEKIHSAKPVELFRLAKLLFWDEKLFFL